jgi:DNA-binding CsgD family transcriptional regulator
MGASPKVARNREILTALAKGVTVRQVAEAHGISRERVHRILRDGCSGRTLALLPGTEKLSSATRGLLIRLGYRSVDAILADLRRGKFRIGCAFGVGPGRFAEVEDWALKLDHVFTS